MLGEAYSRLGRDVDAEPWFLASLSTRPDHIPAHLTYGKLLARNVSKLKPKKNCEMQTIILTGGNINAVLKKGKKLC
jgi:hypothetical protein